MKEISAHKTSPRSAPGFLNLLAACVAGLAPFAMAAPPISLEHVWGRLADPSGEVNDLTRNGVASGESASFSQDGQFIVTSSKSDGRVSEQAYWPLTGGTSHLRFFNLQGDLLWDKPRSRGPIDPATGRPSDQPADGIDESEVAVFSRDDNYIAAGADDGKIEMWRYRDLATGQVLADPVLVKSFPTGGGVDSLFYSHSGDLLFAGSEPNGSIHVFRVQGDPATWQSMHVAIHGSQASHGMNSVAISEDDRYVASAGTNQKGGLWRLDLTRNAGGLITSASLVRLTTMNEAASTLREVRFLPNVGPVSTPRKELLAITAEHDQAARLYSLQQLLNHANPATSPPPILTLRNYFDNTRRIGNPTEALAWTPDGRFMLVTGKTRADGGGTNPNPTNPAYLRFYETAELKPGVPEPDPVYVQEENVRNSEFLDFNSAGSRLTSGHHDGSVRLWNVVPSNHVTIASEGFNERTSTHSRWTITGQAAGSGIGSVGDVTNFTRIFIGMRGARFIAIDKLDPNTSLPSEHILTLSQAWNPAGYRNLQVQFAIAAEVNQFENDDYLILEADTTANGVFETVVARFTSNNPTHKDLALDGTGVRLNLQFRDFVVNLPQGINQPIRFRIRTSTNSTNEEIAFDSLRLIGEPIPPQADSDGDGVSDLFESIHGTNPHDAKSRIAVSASFSGGGEFQASFQGVKNRSYILQRNLLLTDAWQNIGTFVTLPSDQALLLADPDPPADKAFYRVFTTTP